MRIMFTNPLFKKEKNRLKARLSMRLMMCTLIVSVLQVSANAGLENAKSGIFFETVKLPDKKITGVVTDATSGETLAGVTIKIQGTDRGTVTDGNGSFELEAPDDGVLEASFVGYTSATVSLENQSNFDIKLTTSAAQLDQLVVVGYGTQKKANLTGAVDQVGEEVFNNRPMPNVTQGLQGVIPNLNLTINDGKPSRSADYQIRGIGSIGQGGSALVLIDGVEGDPSTLNPNDIESVSVLKDASSAAIYGARAAFGVVLITTKDSKREHTSVTYTGNVSVKEPTIVPQMVTDPVLYTDMFVEAYSSYYDYSRTPVAFHTALPYSEAWYNKLVNRSPDDPEVEVGPDGKYQYFGHTDWYKELYKDHLISHDHNLSIEGGGEKTSFMLSGRYYNQEGLFRYNSDDFTALNLRAKGSIQVFDWLKVSNNLSFNEDRSFYPLTVGNGSVWYGMGSDAQPMSPMFNPDGTLTEGAAYGAGDLWYGKSGQTIHRRTIRNTTSFSTSFFDDHFRVRGDFTFRNTNQGTETKRVPVPFSTEPGKTSLLGSATNDLTNNNSSTNYIATNIYTEYENSFAEVHNFKGLIGYNYEQSTFNSLNSFRNGLLFPDATSLSLANGGSLKIDNSFERWRIAGGFARLNYNYDERYLIELNGRYDGSSKFPVKEQTGFFPSVSVGWRLTEEPYWHLNKKGISNLKLRASYGSLGNGNIASYSFQELFTLSTMSRLINGNLNQQTSTPGVIPEGLTWETATTLNFGLDLGLLNDRLALVGDIYSRKTKDMFATSQDLPAVFGATPPKGNFADMTTNGWELSLAWRDQFTLAGKPFHYNISATLSDYRSKVDKYTNDDKNLSGANAPKNSNYYEGMRLGEIWGFVTEGFYTSQDDIDKSATNTYTDASATKALLPGDIKFADLDNDGDINLGDNTVTNPGDRKIIGNTTPRYAYSFTLGGEWNGIFLNAFFQGIGKQNWWPGNDNLLFWGQYNRPYNNIPKSMIGNIWSEDNPDAYFPRYRGYVALQGTRELSVVQTRYLQNVAYLRLKNLQIGYNLSGQWMEKIGLEAARIYLTGENLFSVSPLYKHGRNFDVAGIYGQDQEASQAAKISGGKDDHISGGASIYNYPTLKSFSLGLSLTF